MNFAGSNTIDAQQIHSMETAMPKSSKRDAVVLFIAEKKLRPAIADACQISVDAIKQWRRVPPLRVVAVERITGIPRHMIRPDIYPTPAPTH